MARLVGILLVIAGWVLWPMPLRAQSHSTLNLGVYPLDCVFERVNDGTNRVVFLTPAQCGQEVTLTNPPQALQEDIPIGIANPRTNELSGGLAARSGGASQSPTTINAQIDTPDRLQVEWAVWTIVGLSALGMLVSIDLFFAQLLPRFISVVINAFIRRG